MEPWGTTSLSSSKRPYGFSRSVSFDLTPQERANLTAYCRHYSIVDRQNRPLSGEAIRLLATIALTEGESAEETASIAIRCQVMMGIAAFGHRLARDFATLDSGGVTVRRDDGGLGVKLVYDTVMLRLIERYSPMFRTETGAARDVLLARELIGAGLTSDRLHEVSAMYSHASASLRAKIEEIESQVSNYVRSAIGEWANGGAS